MVPRRSRGLNLLAFPIDVALINYLKINISLLHNITVNDFVPIRVHLIASFRKADDITSWAVLNVRGIDLEIVII